jgi:hypothetical protein
VRPNLAQVDVAGHYEDVAAKLAAPAAIVDPVGIDADV